MYGDFGYSSLTPVWRWCSVSDKRFAQQLQRIVDDEREQLAFEGTYKHDERPDDVRSVDGKRVGVPGRLGDCRCNGRGKDRVPWFQMRRLRRALLVTPKSTRLSPLR